MEKVQNILTANPCYTASKKISVKGLVLHSVGCPQPSAEVFVRQLNSPSAKVCVHAFIDGNTGKVHQTLPWDYKAWHCGGSGNSTHIGVEMCEPACIKYTGGAIITCSDEEAAKTVVLRTLNAAVELFAELCRQYGLDPLKDGVIVSHKEGHDRGIASGHGDPDHLFRQLHMNYTMDDFRKAVNAALGNGATEGKPVQVQPPAAAGAEAPARTPSPEAAGGAAAGILTGVQVSLTPEAVYYSGKEMPDWVKCDRWIIKFIDGDRAVLGKNTSGTHEINSPVNTKYLHVISGTQPAAVPQPIAGSPKPIAGAGSQKPIAEAGNPNLNGEEMTVSDRGVELIAKYEGCRLDAYKCPAGVWTIGYGHTAGVKQGDKLPSQEAAKALLKEDLKKYGGYVNALRKKSIISFPLTQNRFDALTSFCYNCGNGSLQKLVTGRNAEVVADKLLEYNKGGGKVLTGLTRRRGEERALFLS